MRKKKQGQPKDAFEHSEIVQDEQDEQDEKEKLQISPFAGIGERYDLEWKPIRPKPNPSIISKYYLDPSVERSFDAFLFALTVEAYGLTAEEIGSSVNTNHSAEEIERYRQLFCHQIQNKRAGTGKYT